MSFTKHYNSFFIHLCKNFHEKTFELNQMKYYDSFLFGTLIVHRVYIIPTPSQNLFQHIMCVEKEFNKYN